MMMMMLMLTITTGLDTVEKKFGQGKVDPEKQRGMNEKITDGARGMFEKATGYICHIPFPIPIPSLFFYSRLLFWVHSPPFLSLPCLHCVLSFETTLEMTGWT